MQSAREHGSPQDDLDPSLDVERSGKKGSEDEKGGDLHLDEKCVLQFLLNGAE